jgi:hypothetical protein
MRMIIYAQTEVEWHQTVAYFSDPNNRNKLKSIGLLVHDIDFDTEEVRVDEIEDSGEFLGALEEGMSTDPWTEATRRQA